MENKICFGYYNDNTGDCSLFALERKLVLDTINFFREREDVPSINVLVGYLVENFKRYREEGCDDEKITCVILHGLIQCGFDSSENFHILRCDIENERYTLASGKRETMEEIKNYFEEMISISYDFYNSPEFEYHTPKKDLVESEN
jgi:hypothetical protein